MSATSGASRRNAELKVEYCGEGDDWGRTVAFERFFFRVV
jgi:hypothetical protein